MSSSTNKAATKSSSNPPTPTPAPAPTKVAAAADSSASTSAPASVARASSLDGARPLGKPKKSKAQAAVNAPQHQVSPSFQPRARSRVGVSADAGAKPTSPPIAQPGLSVPLSPGMPQGGARRRSHLGPVEVLQRRRHRRTMSDTPTSPFWSPSFEFRHSEDPEVELEDDQYLAKVKVDEVAPPTEEDKQKQLLRAISFPASLRGDHHRTASFGGSTPVSPAGAATSANETGGGGGAPKSPAKSAGRMPRRRTLGALNCNAKGRPIPGSPRTQALNTRRQAAAAAGGASPGSKHALRQQQQVSPKGPRKGSIGPLSPASAAAGGAKQPAASGFTPVSTQRAERARRALPRRAATDLSVNRPEAAARS